MPITNLLAVVTVGDFDAALTWYERLFGRPADRFPMAGLAEWQITSAGGTQLLHDAERGGGALLTLAVDDLERHVADIAERGITVGAITRGDMAQFASITDPEGNTVTFAEPLGSAD
ncbi:MAG: VOC family protein [Thermomicrobiales bacterium]